MAFGVCPHTDTQPCRWQVCYTAPAELLQLNCPSCARPRCPNPDPHFQSPLAWVGYSFVCGGSAGLDPKAACWWNFFTCFFFSVWSPGLERSEIHHVGSGTFGHQIVSCWIKSRSLKAWVYLDHMGRWISSDISRPFWTDCVCSINMTPSGHGSSPWTWELKCSDITHTTIQCLSVVPPLTGVGGGTTLKYLFKQP